MSTASPILPVPCEGQLNYYRNQISTTIKNSGRKLSYRFPGSGYNSVQCIRWYLREQFLDRLSHLRISIFRADIGLEEPHSHAMLLKFLCNHSGTQRAMFHIEPVSPDSAVTQGMSLLDECFIDNIVAEVMSKTTNVIGE